MKLEIVNNVVRATAETEAESIALLKLNTPIPTPTFSRSAPVVGAEVTRNTYPSKLLEINEKRQVLRTMIKSTKAGNCILIPTEIANCTKDFSNYVWWLKNNHPDAPVKLRTRKKYGGYEVCVIKQ